MALIIICKGCQRKLRVPDTLIGKTMKCPGCARKYKTAAAPKTESNPAATSANQAKSTTKLPAAAKKAEPKQGSPSAAKAAPSSAG